MILTDGEILAEILKGDIVIKPFNRTDLGSNSYDVHLSGCLGVYDDTVIDAKLNNKVSYFEIPEEGYILQPNELYLGCTVEHTVTRKHVPFLEGKSSTGRLGISIHATAGKGDVGFEGTWTLEISCAKPVRVYRGMPIGQLIYFSIDNTKLLVPYNKKPSAKYNMQSNLPIGSMMFMNYQ